LAVAPASWSASSPLPLWEHAWLRVAHSERLSPLLISPSDNFSGKHNFPGGQDCPACKSGRGLPALQDAGAFLATPNAIKDADGSGQDARDPLRPYAATINLRLEAPVTRARSQAPAWEWGIPGGSSLLLDHRKRSAPEGNGRLEPPRQGRSQAGAWKRDREFLNLMAGRQEGGRHGVMSLPWPSREPENCTNICAHLRNLRFQLSNRE